MARQTSMATMSANSRQYPIEEGIEDNGGDYVRIYGSTTERSPLNKGHHIVPLDGNSTDVRIQDPNQRLHLPMDDAASRDSDSLMRGTDGSDNEYDPSQPCWRHPKIRQNWKTVLAATALTVIGCVLVSVGMNLIITVALTQGLVFFVAGVICFIPGVYHLVYIYLAVKGRRGYYFHHLPLFN